MMKVKGIFAVSLIAMVAVVAGTHTSNAVAAIASQGYVDQQIGTKVSTTQGPAAANKAIITNASGNIITGTISSAMITDGTITNADIATNAAIAQSKISGLTTALEGKEVASNKVTSANYGANVSNDTKYPTVKAVADAIADVEEKIPAAITVDSALNSTSTNPVQNKVINTALAGKQATLSAAQLNAVNSGITLTKVSTYDGYNEKITAAQNAADAAAAAANGKVTIAQGSGAANKAVITNSSGNVTTGTISSGMIADGTIVNADIAADAKIATSKISGLAKVATSGLYDDLTGTPTIPTVNNATLTIQKNGDTVDTFTANASANKTINITVPTATSQLTNDSNFITADTLPVATADTLGGVKSGGYITVDTSGAVTVNSADNAKNAKTATNDAEGNDIVLTYATKSEITDLNSTSTGDGAVVTDVSQSAGEVSVTRGNVKIPVGGENATTYATIWVQ